ncbi:Rieske (2Fe-2S) protein [Nocardioides sp. KR10-350]|uniref:Rieske (2Fe-2S) protein n=1 Tax=Nocardioides cheoyonin TaxID=3156615 RepID=UPI0032B4D28F
MDEDACASRRRALCGLAGAGLGLPLLSGCLDKKWGSETKTGLKSSGSGPLELTAADVPVGGGVVVKDRNIVVTQPKEGVVRMFVATCTHGAACQVTKVRDREIICICHGSRFAIADGSVLHGPAPDPLTTQPFRVGEHGRLVPEGTAGASVPPI